MNLSNTYLEECFCLDKSSWTLYWKVRPLYHFNSVRSMNRWNTIHANSKAGTVKKCSKSENFYITVKLDSKNYLTHRIIWQMYYGVIPPSTLDHVDGNGTNNNIMNLRVCDGKYFNNSRNRVILRNNTSGRSGVYWRADRERWVAYLTLWENGNPVQRVRKHFSRYEDAVKYRDFLDEQYNFTTREKGENCND